MVAERRFNGAETGDGPVVKVEGSITKLISGESSSRASREAYCDEEDLEADIAKHIIEEYTELQKFEAPETMVLIVGRSVDRMTELEHFFPQMKLMIIDFLPRCLGSLFDGTVDCCSENTSASDIKEFWKKIELPGGTNDSYVCTGVKATNCFMPKKTLSERGSGRCRLDRYEQVLAG